MILTKREQEIYRKIQSENGRKGGKATLKKYGKKGLGRFRREGAAKKKTKVI